MGADDIENQPQAEAVSVLDKPQVEVGRENLHNTIRPHQSYEGGHRWDPDVSWTPQEERKAIRKTDMMLLSWLCVMVGQPRQPSLHTEYADCMPSSSAFNSTVATLATRWPIRSSTTST